MQFSPEKNTLPLITKRKHLMLKFQGKSGRSFRSREKEKSKLVVCIRKIQKSTSRGRGSEQDCIYKEKLHKLQKW